MKEEQRDLGFGINYKRKTKRIINKDGSFNVIKIGNSFSMRDTYQALLKMSWMRFTFIIFAYLVGINLLFALFYSVIGVENIRGITPGDLTHDFIKSSFFSLQTFTTVGYGHLSPSGNFISIISSIESILGLASFAMMTSVIYGRFSKPSARLLYSSNALIAPYQEGKSLQFRVVNTRMSMLLELHATVAIQFTTEKDGNYHRHYERLTLERDTILFFPLNWTIVHPIDKSSPLFKFNAEDLISQNVEIIIQIKGFDDTFGQTVHSRYSYLPEEIVWGGKFEPAYETSASGDIIFHVDQVHNHKKVSLK
jgi:inward rectifier potassium channel